MDLLLHGGGGQCDGFWFRFRKNDPPGGPKVIANMKSDRFNCLEISRVAAKSFLGLPYVTVAGHPRHIQESIYLFRANHISEQDQATLAAA